MDECKWTDTSGMPPALLSRSCCFFLLHVLLATGVCMHVVGTQRKPCRRSRARPLVCCLCACEGQGLSDSSCLLQYTTPLVTETLNAIRTIRYPGNCTVFNYVAVSTSLTALRKVITFCFSILYVNHILFKPSVSGHTGLELP